MLHHFGTFGTRLWPTKMQARMAFNHSKIRDPVRGRKVGCNSLNAKKRGVAARVANKLLIGCCSKFASLASMHIMIP